MVQRRVEDLPLVVRAALDADTAQIGVPSGAGCGVDRVERIAGRLLGLEVAPRVLRRDIRDAHPHLDLLAFGQIVVREPVADVVTGQLAAVFVVEFVLAVVGGPFGLDARHRALLLPVARGPRRLRDPQHEVDREDLLRVVAERAEELHAFDLRVAYAAHHGTRFVRKPLAQVQQQIALACGERIAFDRRTGRSRSLGPDAVFREGHGVVARRGHFVAVLRAVLAVVGLEFARGGHRQQRSHVGTPYAAQCTVGKSREELVVEFVGGRPPAGILVVEVLVGAHDVERDDGHHAVRQDGAGVRGSEVGGSDEGVDPRRRFRTAQGGTEKGCGERSQYERSSQQHQRIEFFFVNSTISGM